MKYHMYKWLCLGLVTLGIYLTNCSDPGAPTPTEADDDQWRLAEGNGQLVREGLERCRHFVTGWLAHADSITGLIPRNINKDRDIWNAKDAAADNYPFMVLTAALTDQPLFNGRMLDMLNTERLLTSRLGHLPDTYQFSKGGFQNDEVDLESILFGASEYIKDGLMPLTEWLGPSPWSNRMIEILDDIWKHAPIETSFGKIPSHNVELNGEMLQVLSRVYWMTKHSKYIEWAKRLGDYYLLGDQHPTHNQASLRLRDHGCEIISGLCELYASLHFYDTSKQAKYRQPLQELLDRALEVGRNPDGLFYDQVNPQTGEILKNRVADNFGYNLNGFYTLFQLDSIVAYRNATLKALNILAHKYRNFDWENGSADGYADAIEGALNLYNREPIGSVADWMDSEMLVMWNMQGSDGVIEGWHGDGNFARTTIMYCLWKTKGVSAHPWRKDLRVGAEMKGDTIWIAVQSDSTWSGTLKFDTPRHKVNLHLPYDWPRINQFPEWYVVDSLELYTGFQQGAHQGNWSGEMLTAGIKVEKGVGDWRLKLWRNHP